MFMNSLFFAPSSNLPPEYVSGGEVTKRLVYKTDDTEISILKLAPWTTIKVHEHDTDSEIYFTIGTGMGELCPIGSSHKFENNSNDTVYLLSIKSTKILEIRDIDPIGNFIFGV